MPKASQIKKDLKKQEKDAAKEQYKRSTEDNAAHTILSDRKGFLKEHRKNIGVEEIWKAADRAYTPSAKTQSTSHKTLVSDDELGWRSKPIDLRADDAWQEDSVPPNPYIKIQTALGIIVDRNPTAVLSPGAKKYKANNLLMKNLYENSWDIAGSKKAMLKPFVFNSARYGIGVGRTFPLTIRRNVRNLIQYFPEDTKKNKYDDVDQVYFDDVFRESLSPWQVWLDDAGIIGNQFSFNDVLFYKDYEWHKLKSQFGHLQNFKYIKPSEKVLTEEKEMISSDEYAGADKGKKAKLQERVWFYENLELDMFIVETEDGVVLVNEPMPQSPKNKRLSVYAAPWTMRDDRTPYGIGIYEAMRSDHKLYTKYRNMTADQVLLSIYREFFYTGTETLEGDGQMVTRPGRGRQVSDPKNIKWNEIPGPGQDAWLALDYQMARIDDVTGISKSLQGEITGSTAFEISQARESALKRMKTPLEHITDALETEAYISCGIIEDMYSVPKIKLIAEDKFIEPFELEQYETMDGENLAEGRDFERVFREPELSLERNETGEITRSNTKSFFRLKPEDFPWEGTIKIRGQSIIANSELLDRTTTVELANIIVPLFAGPREIGEKPARKILEKYNEDPDEWLPEMWLIPMEQMMPQQEPLFIDPAQAEAEGQAKPEQVDLAGGLSTKIPAANNLANSIKTMGQK